MIGFHQKSVDLLDNARARALRDRCQRISKYHVLEALLEHKTDSDVTSGFSKIGVSTDKVRTRLVGMHAGNLPAHPAAVEFGYGTIKVLRISEEKAESLGRPVIPIDLLYGLLAGGNVHGTLFEILEIPQCTDPESIY